MYGLQYSFREALEMLTFPQFQTAPAGLQMLAYISGQQRDPDTADESYAVVKQTIAKTGFSRQRRVTRAYDDNGGMIPPNTIPDIFEPLRELTRFLLPHLQFETVDLDNEQNIRVLFHRADGDVRNSIDIDDLSSGEKAVISLFLPYVEGRMQRLLSGEPADSGAPLPTTLIDEPEIHLHPTLQVSMLEYMRAMTERGEAQFILTTHSTTILDALSDDELFLLAPVASVGDGNQFLQVTTSQERLEAIRQLTGSTHSVTRGRPIVFIEGVQPSAKGISDRRIVEALMPEAAGWVLVPAGGRTEAIRSATRLRDVASDNLPNIPVFALIDADQAILSDPDYAISWPVAMIENLLLDPVAIWNLLYPVRDRVPTLRSASDIEAELREIARDMREDEIRLRVGASIKPMRVTIEPTDPAAAEAAIVAARTEFDEQLGAVGGAEGVSAVVEKAREAVDSILAEGRELEAFRGKEILKAFHDRHGNRAGINYPAFVYGLAEKVKAESRLNGLVSVPVRRIQRYVPPELVPALEDATAVIPAETPEHSAVLMTLEQARTARTAWDEGSGDGVDRSDLRAALVQTARVLRDRGATDLHQRLLQATVEVGLG